MSAVPIVVTSLKVNLNKFYSNISDLRKIINKYDLMLIVVLTLLSVLFYIQLRSHNKSSVAIVQYKGNIVATLPLSKNTVFKIDDGIIAEVKDGRIRLIESTCKNQFCVKQGWTNSFPIVCVPNELMITIENKKKNEKDIIITS